MPRQDSVSSQPDLEGRGPSVRHHPPFVFNQNGNRKGTTLRPGNARSADGWRDLLEPIVERYRGTGRKPYFRGDAAFASPDIYEYLEAEGILYAIRIKSNSRLYDHIDHLLTRPVGRPPAGPQVFCHEFPYRAGTWGKSRRVVAEAERHRGELLPRAGFIVTNLSKEDKNALRF
jgi:hypothetical protein